MKKQSSWIIIVLVFLLLAACVSANRKDSVFENPDIVFKVTNVYEDQAVLEGKIVTKNTRSFSVGDKYKVLKYNMNLGVAKVVGVNVDMIKLRFEEESDKSAMEMVQITDMLILRHYENEALTTGKSTDAE